jgi:hypothetical protein
MGKITDWIKDNPAAAAAAGAGLYGALNKNSKIGEFMFGEKQRPVGYTGGIPEYKIERSLAPNAFAATTPEGQPRRPGSGGRRYFTDTKFTPTGKVMAPAAQTPTGGVYNGMSEEDAVSFLNNMFGNGGLGGTQTAAKPKYTDAQVKGTLDTLIKKNTTDKGTNNEALYRDVAGQIKSFVDSGGSLDTAAQQISSTFRMPDGSTVSPEEVIAKYRQLGFAQGGLASLPQARGYYLGGATDGMADRIPATIEDTQPAALSDGEFVIPADVVSHLGNGNSDAGAKQLYAMMDRIRQARTGRKEQGRKINPNKYIPV